MDQKCAIVTGAARGIGLATAKLFLEQGWRVALLDRDSDELVKQEGTPDTLLLTLDVSKPEDVEAMASRTLDWAGRVDALVNNAGVAEFGPVEATDFEGWRRVMATNHDGVFLCTQAATPALRVTQGSIETWYENGQKREEFTMKSGKVLSVEVWKPNGEKCPVSLIEQGTGVYVWYMSDGSERERIRYVDGQPVVLDNPSEE